MSRRQWLGNFIHRYRKGWPWLALTGLLMIMFELGETHQRAALAFLPLLTPLFTIVCLVACILHLLNLREVYLDREALYRAHVDGAMREAAGFIIRNERARLLKSMVLLAIGLNTMLGLKIAIYLLILIPPISLIASAIDLRERHGLSG